MKMKLLAAAPVAFAVIVTRVDASYWSGNATSSETSTGFVSSIGIDIPKQHPPQYLEAFSKQSTMAGKSSKKARARNNKREAQNQRDRSPAGTPSSSKGTAKEEDRRDSAIRMTSAGPETRLEALSKSFWSRNVNDQEATGQASSKAKSALAHATRPQPCRQGPRRIPWSDFIQLALLFCLVFGALYVLLQYLLSVTRTLAESCSPSTVFVPITQNVTTTETVFYNAPPPSAEFTTVLLETVAATTTVTASLPVSEAAVSSPPGAPYTFSVVDSTTLWEGGVSPTSGAQLSVATSIVTLLPIDSTAAELTTHMTLTSTSTLEKLTTITLPASTSTAYSLLSTMLRTTSTSTHYVTLSLSAVPSRSSFSGMSSGGWNATITQPNPSQAGFTSVLPTMTTLTETHYYGNGNSTTSTSSNRITTTLGAIITTTLLAPTTVVTLNIPGAPLSATTVTAEPVTVTYTVQSQSLTFSTSISFSSIQNSAALDAARATSVDLESALPTTTILSSAQPTLPPSYPIQPSSSFSATFSTSYATNTNRVSPATVTASSPTLLTSAQTSSEIISKSESANISAAGLPTQHTAATIFTVTSFLSGLDTTLVVTSLPSLMTPISSISSNNISVSSATKIGSVQSTASSLMSTVSSTTSSSTTAGDEVTSSRSLTKASGSSTGSVRSTSGSTSTADLSRSSSITGSLSSGRSSSGFSSGASRSSTRISSIASQSATKPASAPSQTFLAGSTSSTSMLSTRASTASLQRTNSTVSVFATKTTQSSLGDSFPASSATSVPTQGCGEQGNFTMNFDDLPTFHPDRSAKRHDRRQSNGTSSGGNDITKQPPLDLRPYHHLTFSNGFVYAPQRVEPFAPVSQPNVAAFLADGTGMRTGGRPSDLGEIDGPAPDDVSAFWFDAFSAFLGCDNGGPGNCTMEVTGLRWDPDAKYETPAFAQNYTLPPCPSYRDCTLTPITLPSTARNLSGLEIRAVRNGKPRMFFMDDMHMAWSNKTCEAGMLRQETR